MFEDWKKALGFEELLLRIRRSFFGKWTKILEVLQERLLMIRRKQIGKKSFEELKKFFGDWKKSFEDWKEVLSGLEEIPFEDWKKVLLGLEGIVFRNQRSSLRMERKSFEDQTKVHCELEESPWSIGRKSF